MNHEDDDSQVLLSLTSPLTEEPELSKGVGKVTERLAELLQIETHICVDTSKHKINFEVNHGSGEVFAVDPAVILNQLRTKLQTAAIATGEKQPPPLPGSWLTVPLLVSGQTCGYVALHDTAMRAWGDKEIGYIQVIADAIGNIISSETSLRIGEGSTVLLESLFELAPDAYFFYDLTGALIDGNRAAEILVGYDREELIGKSFLKLKILSAGQIPRAARQLLKNAVGRSTGPDLYDLIRKDGTNVQIEVMAHPVKIEGRTIVLAIARDVSTRISLERRLKQSGKELEEQVEIRTKELQETIRRLESTEQEMQKRATLDPITKLPNRFVLTDRLRRLLTSSNRINNRHAVLVFDVNGFASVNARYGQRVGDALLEMIARRAEKMIRPEDTVCRLNADAFATVIEQIGNERNAAITAARLLVELSNPYKIRRNVLSVTCNVGITLSGDYTEPNGMLRDAETALKQAKKKGKSRYELFDSAVRIQTEQRLGLEEDLRNAIGADEMRVFYQPIVELSARKLAGFEALVRWYHRGELVQPGTFIPLAEQSGIIVPLSSWLMRRVCAQIDEWNEETNLLIDMVSLNLSAKDFAKTADVVGRLGLAVSDARLHPAQLRVEVTESALIEDVESAIECLEAIREIGVKVELDDFGTGYSSLSYLHRFPIDALKIDRSFVMRIPDTSSVRVVRTIVRLAADLGIEVIAEGVETEEQLEHLVEMGCGLGQGYLFSKPIPVEEATGFIERQTIQ